MSTVSRPSSPKIVPTQADDQKAIVDAGAKATAKLATVGAQAEVAEGAAKIGLGQQKAKDYVIARAKSVGETLTGGLKCASAEAIFASIQKMEPAETVESPLVEGAKTTLGVADKTLTAFAGARAALDDRASKIPVNLDCTPKKPEPPKAEPKKTEQK